MAITLFIGKLTTERPDDWKLDGGMSLDELNQFINAHPEIPDSPDKFLFFTNNQFGIWLQIFERDGQIYLEIGEPAA